MPGEKTIRIENFDRVLEALTRATEPAKHPDEMFYRIAQRIATEAVPNHFLKKESPDGSPWAELYAPYGVRKMREKGSLDVLIWSGDLMRSVRAGVDKGDTLTAWVMAGGPDVPYAGTHNYGLPEKNIPKREFLGFGTGESEIIADSIDRWLAGMGGKG